MWQFSSVFIYRTMAWLQTRFFCLFFFLRRVSPPKNPVHATHFSTVQHLPHSQTARCCKKNTGVWRAARAYKKPKEVPPTYVGYNYARLTPDHLPRVKVVSPVAKTESMKSFPSRLDHEVSRLCGTPLYPFPSHFWRQWCHRCDLSPSS